MTVAPKTLTLKQFLKLPEQEPPLEFEEGRIIQKVSPKGRHSALQFGLAKLFDGAQGINGIVRVLPELRSTFGGRSYVPDLAIYQRERIPVDEQGRIQDVFVEPPDIAIEIVSPEQSVVTLIAKCEWYVANGVPIALLVDPGTTSIRLFQANARVQELRGNDPINLETVLPAFSLTVDQVFASLKVR
jgi:Uma2 family endonuclease